MADQGFFTQIEHILRGGDNFKQLFGCLVDPDIGGLGRQGHGHQQGVNIGVIQLAFGFRVGIGQALKEFFYGGFAHLAGHRDLCFWLWGAGTAYFV